jgi:hypothetical protein
LSPSEVSDPEVTFSVGLTSAGAFATFRPLAGGTTLALEAGPWLGVLSTAVLSPAGQPPSVVASSPGDFLFAAISAGASFEAHVTTEVFITARGALLAPLVRRQLSISEEVRTGTTPNPVWTQPALSGLLSAGLGIAFF